MVRGNSFRVRIPSTAARIDQHNPVHGNKRCHAYHRRHKKQEIDESGRNLHRDCIPFLRNKALARRKQIRRADRYRTDGREHSSARRDLDETPVRLFQ